MYSSYIYRLDDDSLSTSYHGWRDSFDKQLAIYLWIKSTRDITKNANRPWWIFDETYQPAVSKQKDQLVITLSRGTRWRDDIQDERALMRDWRYGIISADVLDDIWKDEHSHIHSSSNDFFTIYYLTFDLFARLYYSWEICSMILDDGDFGQVWEYGGLCKMVISKKESGRRMQWRKWLGISLHIDQQLAVCIWHMKWYKCSTIYSWHARLLPPCFPNKTNVRYDTLHYCFDGTC